MRAWQYRPLRVGCPRHTGDLLLSTRQLVLASLVRWSGRQAPEPVTWVGLNWTTEEHGRGCWGGGRGAGASTIGDQPSPLPSDVSAGVGADALRVRNGSVDRAVSPGQLSAHEGSTRSGDRAQPNERLAGEHLLASFTPEAEFHPRRHPGHEQRLAVVLEPFCIEDNHKALVTVVLNKRADGEVDDSWASARAPGGVCWMLPSQHR